MPAKRFGLPLGQEQIMEIIPHRPPFLFVHRITELEPGQRAVGMYTVSEEDCQGHFPGNPIMPGVKLLEAMNQVGAVALLASEELAGKIAVFRGVDIAKFGEPVKPGDELVIKVERVEGKGPLGKCKGEIAVNDERAAFATTSFVIRDSL